MNLVNNKVTHTLSLSLSHVNTGHFDVTICANVNMSCAYIDLNVLEKWSGCANIW